MWYDSRGTIKYTSTTPRRIVHRNRIKIFHQKPTLWSFFLDKLKVGYHSWIKTSPPKHRIIQYFSLGKVSAIRTTGREKKLGYCLSLFSCSSQGSCIYPEKINELKIIPENSQKLWSPIIGWCKMPFKQRKREINQREKQKCCWLLCSHINHVVGLCWYCSF